MSQTQSQTNEINRQLPDSIPSNTPALHIANFGIEGLQLAQRPTPIPGPSEVLIRVEAAALNYLDLLVVEGTFNNQLPLPHIPGTDVAGTVVAVGNGVTQWQVGDRVMSTFIRNWRHGTPAQHDNFDLAERPSLGRPGLFAQYVVLDTQDVVQAPVNWTSAEAATLVIAGLTAWNGLKYASLQPGETLLLFGTGGVSVFALQLGLLRGARVLVVGGDDAKLDRMRSLGASATWNYHQQPDWPELVRTATNGRGADVAFEVVGGDNLNRTLQAIANGGRIPMVGLLAGFQTQINAGLLLNRQAQIIGMEVGSTQDLATLVHAVNQTSIRPVIDRMYPVAQAQDAFRYLKSGQHFGKVTLTF